MNSFFTRHFHDRLFARYGIKLSEGEMSEIKKAVLGTYDGVPFDYTEGFDIFLRHRNIRFFALLKNGRLVTAHAKKGMGRKKYLKWNSDPTKNSLLNKSDRHL